MLYPAESLEIVSPIVLREQTHSPSKVQGWSQALENRWAQPRVDLAICLGSHSLVITKAGRNFVYPARVAVRTATGKTVAFGPQAADIEGREPEGVVVCRPIASGVVMDQRLATQLLSAALSASRHGLVSGLRVALAIPSDLTAVESQALLATVKASGARKIYLVEQTLAAAIGAGRDLAKAEGHLVIQVGAGVTHVSVCSLASTVLSRTLRVGGDSINTVIRDHVRREHQLLIDDRVAESIKRELGSALPPVGDSVMTIAGRDTALGKPTERRINAQEVYGIVSPLLALIAQEVRWVVSSMPTALLSDVVKNGVILSGGGAELRRLDEFLAQETRLRVQIAACPEEVVSKGLQTLLREPILRKAVFHQGTASSSKAAVQNSERQGTGLLGALFLTAGLALATYSSSLLAPGALSSVDQYLGAAFTPTTPLFQGWGPQTPGDNLAQHALVQNRETELEKENNRLRKLLNAPLAKPTLNPLAADVVARDPRGWMSTLTLNVGTSSDIEVGMTVTDGTNLVGKVIRVEANRCQVRLFTDSKMVVAAKVPKKKGSGVVVGTGSDDVQMRYLDPDSGVKTGDWVVTSGHDETFPAGLKLGWITNVTQLSGQNTYTANIQPGMNVHHLQNVLILRK